MNVPYEAKGDGGTILVPADQVTKLRMAAGRRQPAVRRRRLRDLRQVRHVRHHRLRAEHQPAARAGRRTRPLHPDHRRHRSARVHLVIPERQIFCARRPAADRLGRAKTRGVLGRGQVQAIQHLVAAAVSGLTPTASPSSTTRAICSPAATTRTAPTRTASRRGTAHHRFRGPPAPARRVHRRQRRRRRPCRASQVTADMDYNRTSNTVARPSIPTARSCARPRRSSSNTDTNGSGGAAPSRSATRCPATSARHRPRDGTQVRLRRAPKRRPITRSTKTTKTSTVDGGDGEAALGRGRGGRHARTDGGNYTPRTPAEMKQIDSPGELGHRLRREARRHRAGRQHAFARIDAGAGTPAPAPLLGLDGPDWFKIIEVAILSLTALLIGFFVARPLISRMFAPDQLAGAQADAGAPVIAGQLPAPAGAAGDASRQQVDAAAQPHALAGAARQHRSTSRRSKARCANPPSARSAKSSARIPKKRWRSSAPGSINRRKTMARAAKPPSRKTSASSPAPSARPIIMLSLGEEHCRARSGR